MSMSNASETALLNLLFKNLAWADVGDANPLEVTPTSRTAGDVVQDVATAGDTVTVSRVP